MLNGTIFKWIKEAGIVFGRHYLRIIIPYLLTSFLSIISLFMLTFRQHEIAWLIVRPILVPCYLFYYVEILRKNEYEIKDIVVRVMKCSGYLWVTALLTFLCIGAGVLLFIVPGVIIAVACSMSLISSIDKNLSPVKAIKYSIEITKPHFWELSVLYIYFIVSVILLQHRFTTSLLYSRDVFFISSILHGVFLFLVGPFNMLLYATAYKNIAQSKDITCIESSRKPEEEEALNALSKAVKIEVKGDWDCAMILYQKIISDYSSTQIAKDAAIALESLKKKQENLKEK